MPKPFPEAPVGAGTAKLSRVAVPLLLALLALGNLCTESEAAAATAEGGEGRATTVADAGAAVPPPSCPAGRCLPLPSSSRRRSPKKKYDLFGGDGGGGGGSAQAYKPNASIKNVVCDNEESEERRYLAASLPMFRRSIGSGAPAVEFRGRIWSCGSSSSTVEDEKGGEKCEASVPPAESLKALTIEVWQARPDGSYSSLTPGYDEGECRATLDLSSSSLLSPAGGGGNEFRFDTVAPGSTGALGGLGPSGWYDFPPYGPPVIHLLIRSAPGYYETLLIEVEIMPEGRTTFRGGDWRGRGWAGVGGGGKRSSSSAIQYEVTTIEEGRSIVVDADFFLTPAAEEEKKQKAKSLTEELCQSRLYGLRPRSFFTEPIAVCAPSLLDYFDL